MADRAAISRTGIGHGKSPSDLDPRVHLTLPALRALETQARAISFLPKQPARSALNGRHTSRIRGRGLDFEELRDYLPSDDVRAIDWKVTARTGTPFVRVYTEERDRPTLILVDQRMSMFFGTQHNTKAVTAGECAAIAAFRILDQGDRVGGIVFGDQHIAEVRPKRSRASLTQFLSRVADANALLHAKAPEVKPTTINQVLRAVQRIATRDHLVIIISDFNAVNDATRHLLGGISRRNDLVLGLVSDPSSQDLPSDARVTASDGTLQAEFNLQDDTVRQDLISLSRGRIADVMAWQNHMKVSILPLTTAEDTLPQMLGLLGRTRV